MPKTARVVLRKPLRAFSVAMEEKLRRRDHRGRTGWRTASQERLFNLLWREFMELHAQMARGEPVAGECVDIANFAMMLHDNEVRHVD